MQSCSPTQDYKGFRVTFRATQEETMNKKMEELKRPEPTVLPNPYGTVVYPVRTPGQDVDMEDSDTEKADKEEKTTERKPVEGTAAKEENDFIDLLQAGYTEEEVEEALGFS
ncbi:hypothetical protein L7F22_017464 [Adiantum nelumboides]|nr:hypothetical protein [Adiantum nelumboides]